MNHAQAPFVIVPVPAFKDNYLRLIRRGRAAVVVDPGDAAPVEAALAQHGLSLDAILLTHHPDHMGGVDALVSARPASRLPVYGPASERIACVTQPLANGDRVALASLGLAFDVLSVPGHTRGHIAYFCAAPDASIAEASNPRRPCCSAAIPCSRAAADGCSKERRRRCMLP